MPMSPPPLLRNRCHRRWALAFEIRRLFANENARKGMKSFAGRGIAPSQGRSACES